MNKVIIINLNGNAYHLDEQGYEIMRAYLDNASKSLESNPDRTEIISDLEQALGEKCAKYLTSHKSVVSHKEVEQIIKEMGPVEGAGANTNSESAKDSADKTTSEKKKLFRIPEGEMIAGVCNGLAVYFDIDATIVRLTFVVLTVLTHGFFAAVYFVMMFMVPIALTTEDRAEARGKKFSAQDLVDRAKKSYQDFNNKAEWKEWKRKWKYENKYRKYQYKYQAQTPAAGSAHNTGVGKGMAIAMFSLLSAVLFIAWIVTIITLLSTGMFFGLIIPFALPVWVAVVIVTIVYGLISRPLKMARRGFICYSTYNNSAVRHDFYYWSAFDGIFWIALVAFLFWVAYTYIPQAHAALSQAPVIWHNAVATIKQQIASSTTATSTGR